MGTPPPTGHHLKLLSCVVPADKDVSMGDGGGVDSLCPILCDPVDRSMPGFPVFHYLPEFAQTHVHWVSDAIQPSHPLSPPSPPALHLS